MIQRMGRVIGIDPEGIEQYKKLHANPWPGTFERLRKRNIQNFSIFLREPENLLFSYWEYTGTDLASDLAHGADDPRNREWLELTGALQRPLTSRADHEWWSPMEQVFHAT